jgi:hypothetical protein
MPGPTIATTSTTALSQSSAEEVDTTAQPNDNPLESGIPIQPQGLLPPRNIHVCATCLQTDIRPNIFWKALYILDIDMGFQNPGIWTISGRSTRSYDVNPIRKSNTVGQSYTIIGKVAQDTGKAYWKELQNGTAFTALWKGWFNFETSHFDGEYYYLPQPPSTHAVHTGTLKSTEHLLKPLAHENPHQSTDVDEGDVENEKALEDSERRPTTDDKLSVIDDTSSAVGSFFACTGIFTVLSGKLTVSDGG